MKEPCNGICRGEGIIHETRTCSNPRPQHGGARCSGKEVQNTPCFGDCGGKCVVKELFLCTILLHINICLQLYKVLVILPFFASL